MDSNHGPTPYQSVALPGWAIRQYFAAPLGIEPRTFALTGRCSTAELRSNMTFVSAHSLLNSRNPGTSVQTFMAVRMGFEPMISRVTGGDVDHYTNEPIITGSNPFIIRLSSYFVSASRRPWALTTPYKHPVLARCWTSFCFPYSIHQKKLWRLRVERVVRFELTLSCLEGRCNRPLCDTRLLWNQSASNR